MRNNETTLEDHHTPRMSHNELLLRLNRADALASIKAGREADKEHSALRALMIEKHGLERVEEVEIALRASHKTN
jgi:hypothetical protein